MIEPQVLAASKPIDPPEEPICVLKERWGSSASIFRGKQTLDLSYLDRAALIYVEPGIVVRFGNASPVVQEMIVFQMTPATFPDLNAIRKVILPNCLTCWGWPDSWHEARCRLDQFISRHEAE